MAMKGNIVLEDVAACVCGPLSHTQFVRATPTLQLYRLFAKGQPVPRARLAHRLSSRPLDFVAESFNVLNHTNAVSLNQFYGPENSPIPVFTRPNKAGIPRQSQFSIDFEY